MFTGRRVNPAIFALSEEEPCDGLGYYPPFLGLGPPFHQHLQVQFLRGQPFQGVLAYLPEVVFVHVLEEPVLQVRVSQSSGVVVPEYPLHLIGGKDLSDHVEHGVVVQGVPDFL